MSIHNIKAGRGDREGCAAGYRSFKLVLNVNWVATSRDGSSPLYVLIAPNYNIIIWRNLVKKSRLRQVITCFLKGEQTFKCNDTLKDAAMHAIFQTVGGDKCHLDVVATADVFCHPVDTSSERFLIRNVDFGIWLQNNKKKHESAKCFVALFVHEMVFWVFRGRISGVYLSTKRYFRRFVDE